MRPVPPRLLLAVTALLAGAVAWPRLPTALPEDAPPDVFSAERALTHVRAWAATPRPSGSAAHAAVVAGVAEELERLGFVVERESLAGERALTNLVAHAPGADPRGGVWLVAHTDTVPGSPGAADDGLGLGVIAETARLLARDGVPPGLHVLLTDGEELGLLGARAHVARARAEGRADTRLVLNVEARGTEGPAYMFQLAGAAPALLDAWQAAGCGAQATSLARAVYDQLPNDTDFTVFRRAGWWGYDFALIGGAWRYHTPADTPANLDPRSVQQVGDCVSGLARVWLARPVAPGAVEAAVVPEGGPVWFQVPGGTLVVPAWVVRLLGVAALLALPRPRGWRPYVGVVAWVAAVVLAVAGGFGLLHLAVAARPDFWQAHAEMVGPEPWYAAAAAVGIGAGLLTGARGAAGWHIATVVVAAAAAGFAPAVGYVLVPGAWASVLLARDRPGYALVPAALAGLLLTPLLYAIFPALTTRMLPVLAAVPVLTLGWLLGALPPVRPSRTSGSA